MLIIALVLALIGLVALVFAVVTSNELVAWVCIGASVLGVVLLIVDALRERQGRDAVALERDEESGADSESAEEAGDDAAAFVDYPEEVADEGDHEPKSSEEVASTDASEESAVPADGPGEDSAK
jgi:hypothetical protein